MHDQNFKQLLSQLQILLSDEDVQQAIEPQLNQRASKLLKNQSVKSGLNNFNTENSRPLQTLSFNSVNSTKSLKKHNFKKILNVNASGENRNINHFLHQKSQNSLYKQKSKSKSKSKYILKTEPCEPYQQTPQYPNSCTNSNEIEIVDFIQTKQQQVRQEKTYLQSKVNEMKHLIDEQKERITRLSQETSILNSQLAKTSQNSTQTHNSFQISKKKLQSLFTEVKTLNQSHQSTKQQNQQVYESLQEQRELVRMYRTVIQELKSQMKIQKQEYDQVKKKFGVLKKTQQVAKVKFVSMNGSSTGIMENLKDSINKWK